MSRGAGTACLATAVGTAYPAPKLVGNGGPRQWSMTRDEKGYRDYKIKYRVQCGTLDGPYRALRETAGLPEPGSEWNIDHDHDEWAYCTQVATVTPVAKEGEPNQFFDIEQVFSSKPSILCQDDSGGFDDPLLRADIISGSFVKYTKEAFEDSLGDPILTSSWEQFRGPQVEFDANRLQVRVTQNVACLELDVLADLIDSINLMPMWDMEAGCVKFSGCSWEKHYHTDCTVYYTRVLEFDINAEGFHRFLLDEGTKALPGHYNAEGAYVIDLAAAYKYPMTRTTGSPTLTISTGTFSKIVVGHRVEGPGIPNNTTVIAVTFPTVTMSANATSDGTDSTKFGVTADPNNPHHFVRFQDRAGNTGRVILDGHGRPWDPAGATSGTGDDVAGRIRVDYYHERDLTTLSIPTTLDVCA